MSNGIRCAPDMVAQAEQYEWSSAAIHLGLAPDRLHLADVEFWRQREALRPGGRC